MRLAQHNAIYDRIKTRGQELKEVDKIHVSVPG